MKSEDGANIKDLIKDHKWDVVSGMLASMHPADIADVIDRSPSSVHKELFSLVSDEIKPDVLAELEDVAGSGVVEALTNAELSELVSEMAPDDAADVLGELPEKRSEQVLGLMEQEESEDVRKLLEYDEETAGGIMTTDVVAMKEDQTVAEALEAIAYLDVDEKFYFANVVDGRDRMIGYVNIWELLRERNRKRPLGELIHRDYRAATVDMDQEEVAKLAGQYDLDVVPVVDENGILVGRVTADDIIHVMEEEASEDIFRLAGSDDAELESASVVKSCGVRLPWLFVTLLGGFVTSIILGEFISHISGVMALAAFVPVVLAMGGNTGIQSSTLVVRSIALGGLMGRSVSRLLLKEILTGAFMGLVCGLIIGSWAHFVISKGGSGEMDISAVSLAIVVALALFSSMTFAAVFGAFVPIVLDKMKIDPAVASGPFISITNDISSLLIYFGVTVLLISRLM